VSTGDVGLDAFYNLTPALRANLTVNTDFAETEVDDQRVNLTRFPLFFEEKRDFFLEGSSFFDFSREGGEEIVPFFSRRIGLDVRGLPQRIDLGAKLTGQAGAFDLGVLQVRTGEGDTRPGEDFSVIRVRRRALQHDVAVSPRHAGHRRSSDRRSRLRLTSFAETRTSSSGFYVWTSHQQDRRRCGCDLRASCDPADVEVAVREVQASFDPDRIRGGAPAGWSVQT
jgi:hypothetical protein